MKSNILHAAALSILALAAASCDDDKMEWYTPDGHYPISSADIPLATKEQIANYKDIKVYAAEYMPNALIGIGMGIDKYLDEPDVKDMVDANYQIMTAGNAMKMDAMVKASGDIDFTKVDKWLDAMPADMKLYGHNFFWYQQTRQNYLLGLIAPKPIPVASGSDIENLLVGDSFNFEGGTKGSWGSWGNDSESAVSAEGEGYESDYSVHLVNPTDGGDGADYKAQFAYTFSTPLVEGTTYMISFVAKSSIAGGQVQFCHQNSTNYNHQIYKTFSVGTDWTLCEYEFEEEYDDVDRILINFGSVAAEYWIDNIKFGPLKDQGNKSLKASGPLYTLKTAEEKAEILTAAMEAWVKGVADHLAEKGVVPYGYDVINEAITDGSNLVRGVDAGAFGGSDTDDDGNVTYDSEPVEDDVTGLKLNWGSNRFYWGYYVKDYAVKAFTYARQYLPAETKLFINDYNLEVSPGKLDALIAFVNKIDADYGSAVVDGIGTQMHLSISTSDDADKNADNVAALKEQVDAMFKTMAATGKLVRVTELDVAIGTSSPSAAQLQAQADVYRMVVESFKDNVPEAQQSGITIWGFSDAEDEHEYWLKGEVPNLLDADYNRKIAYKGFCDGIAGMDISTTFSGDQWDVK